MSRPSGVEVVLCLESDVDVASDGILFDALSVELGFALGDEFVLFVLVDDFAASDLLDSVDIAGAEVLIVVVFPAASDVDESFTGLATASCTDFGEFVELDEIAAVAESSGVLVCDFTVLKVEGCGSPIVPIDPSMLAIANAACGHKH